jgi:hypothetical protein
LRFITFAALGAAAAVLTACEQPVPADAGTPLTVEATPDRPAAAAAVETAADAAVETAVAAAPEPAAPRLEPRRGLWRTTLDGGEPMPAMCGTGENLEGLRQAQANASGGIRCNPDNPFRREGDAWVARTNCTLHSGGPAETVMTVTGDLDTRFRVEIATTNHGQKPDTRIAYTVERDGDC